MPCSAWPPAILARCRICAESISSTPCRGQSATTSPVNCFMSIRKGSPRSSSSFMSSMLAKPKGPFTFIPADETTRILAEIRARRSAQGKPHVGRYLDEEIEAVGGNELDRPAAGTDWPAASRSIPRGVCTWAAAFRREPSDLCLYLQDCTTPETDERVRCSSFQVGSRFAIWR